MHTRLFYSYAAAVLLGINSAFAAEKAATVTVAVNQVDYGTSASSEHQRAPVGTLLEDGDFLKTGVLSRAELQLPDENIARLGANTIFNYSLENNEVDLQAGTILFSKKKDSRQLNIKTAAVTAAIVGTTGFVQVRGNGFIFGLIEGHSTVTIGGVKFTITAGQLLSDRPGSPPQIFDFNVPLLVKTSPFFTKFHNRLPNQRYIDKEIADYNDLVARGFIQPPKHPFFLTGFDGSVPTIPITAIDSAGNALKPVTQPSEPPPDYNSNPNGGR